MKRWSSLQNGEEIDLNEEIEKAFMQIERKKIQNFIRKSQALLDEVKWNHKAWILRSIFNKLSPSHSWDRRVAPTIRRIQLSKSHSCGAPVVNSLCEVIPGSSHSCGRSNFLGLRRSRHIQSRISDSNFFLNYSDAFLASLPMFCLNIWEGVSLWEI